MMAAGSLGGLELALLHELARLIGITRAVGKLYLVHHRSQVGTVQYFEVRLAQLEFAEVGDIVGAELCAERGVVALDFPRYHN